MQILESFIQNYLLHMQKPKDNFSSGINGKIAASSQIFLSDMMSPSKELKERIDYLHVRSIEPMKIAITGQFSSGKSTFINALLSQKVLPTGITPVTSKVNYIRYGDEYKVRLHYKDGRDEYRNIEDLAYFTDQRKDDIEEISHLSIYAPLELLQDIIFVDTPGLNSQAHSDTATTHKVLKDVDGIIWLTLIDNAGKMSEVKVLQEYMHSYKDKALCLLNQKDKLNDDQVQKSVTYVKSALGEFFSEVIAISAKQALESRSQDKSAMVQVQMQELLSNLEKVLNDSQGVESVVNLYEEFEANKREIQNMDLSANLDILQKSNIEAVLDFIYENIQPAVSSAKEYAISKELKDISQQLIEQHELFIDIYDKLDNELKLFEQEASIKLEELQKRFSLKLHEAYLRIEEMIDTIAQHIFAQIHMHTFKRYEARVKKVFKGRKKTYLAKEYKAPKIDSDQIYKKLFYDDEIVHKMFKQYGRNLSIIQDEVNENNSMVYELIKKRVRSWQGPYEFIRKPHELHSDIEYANIRKFASKVYENILKPYSNEIHASYAQVSSQFNHLSSAVSFNYQNATEVSIAFIQNKIEQSIKLFEENPNKFSIYSPKLQEIKDRLKISFHLHELQNMMDSDTTFLHKNYAKLIESFANIRKDRHEFLKSRKSRHEKIIQNLLAHIDTL